MVMKSITSSKLVGVEGNSSSAKVAEQRAKTEGYGERLVIVEVRRRRRRRRR